MSDHGEVNPLSQFGNLCVAQCPRFPPFTMTIPHLLQPSNHMFSIQSHHYTIEQFFNTLVRLPLLSTAATVAKNAENKLSTVRSPYLKAIYSNTTLYIQDHCVQE